MSRVSALLRARAPAPLRTNFPTSSLGNSRDIEAVKRNGFHDQRTLVVHLDDPRLGWDDRALLEGIGRRLYGGKPQ